VEQNNVYSLPLGELVGGHTEMLTGPAAYLDRAIDTTT